MNILELDPQHSPFAGLLARRHEEREAWWTKHAGDRVLISKIVWDMVQMIDGQVKPKDDRGPNQVGIELGFLIEELLAEEFGKRLGWSKPPAIFRDGIGCRPDGKEHNRQGIVTTIDEIKVTWKSRRQGIEDEKFRNWHLLMRGYMAAQSYQQPEHPVTRARLHVFFINGDYPSGAPSPELPSTFIFRSTVAENERTWAQIKGHAEDRGWLPVKGSRR